MKSFPLTVVKGGISRLRTKGGVRADWLYDCVNAYVTEQGTVVPREGTVRHAQVPGTIGLCAFEDALHVFADQVVAVPEGYVCHVLANPADDDVEETSTLVAIHFAQPFMGALYVVAEWSDGEILHYWLASSGDWQASTVYKDNDVVEPTTPNGLLYKATPNNPDAAEAKVWTPSTAYAIGDRIIPSVYNGYYYEVVDTEGSVPSSGRVEPNWIANEGAIVIEAAYSQATPSDSTTDSGVPQIPSAQQDRYGETSTSPASSSTTEQTTDAVPKWAPGTLYNPGDLVTPRSATPAIPDAIPNANFEGGDTGWTKGTGWSIVNTGDGTNGNKPYQGSYFAKWVESDTSGAWRYLEMATKVPVVPGQFVSASCYDSRKGGSNSGMEGQLVLIWYDAVNAVVKISEGTSSNADKAKDYRPFYVSDLCPGGATQLVAAYRARGGNVGGQCAIDAFVWDYQNLSPTVADFTTYQATQATAGFSGTEEPVWPGAGNSVVDNDVTWLGGVSSVIEWQAKPIMKSGVSEPTWQTQPGSATPDGTVSWLATTGFVEQAPNSKVVAIAAKKVFAADEDIVKYSATVNPLDWATAEDAGYLPVGLNTHGANPTKVLNLYRGNLMAFNSAGFQMWQVDEDPALNSLLDAIPVGSTYQRAAQPVRNDLLFLTKLGVRSVAIAGASTNLQAGNVGEPIDSLVVAKLQTGGVPNSVYYPARGQYWLWFGDEVFVLTMNDAAPAWSRYIFPEAITDATLLNDDLYLRTENDKVWKVDAEALLDDLQTTKTVVLAVDSLGVDEGVPVDPENLDTTDEIEMFEQVIGFLQGATTIIPDVGNYAIFTAESDGDLAAIAGQLNTFFQSQPLADYELSFDGDPVTVTDIEFIELTDYGLPGVYGAVLEYTGSPASESTDMALSFPAPANIGEEFEGVIQWPALDCGALGIQKMLYGFDLICTGEVSVQIAYDQRNFNTLTDGYLVDGDTLPGTPIPLPVTAPSFSLRLTFSGNQAWEHIAANLYMADFRGAGATG